VLSVLRKVSEHLHVFCAAATPHAAVGAGLFTLPVGGFADSPCALLTQAKVSLGRYTARRWQKGTCRWYGTFTGRGTTLLLGMQRLVLTQAFPSCMSGWSTLLARCQNLCLGKKPHTDIPGRGEGRAALGTSHRQDAPMSPCAFSPGKQISLKELLQHWLILSHTRDAPAPACQGLLWANTYASPRAGHRRIQPSHVLWGGQSPRAMCWSGLGGGQRAAGTVGGRPARKQLFIYGRVQGGRSGQCSQWSGKEAH